MSKRYWLFEHTDDNSYDQIFHAVSADAVKHYILNKGMERYDGVPIDSIEKLDTLIEDGIFDISEIACEEVD